MGKFRNTAQVVEQAQPHYARAVGAGLMQVNMTRRRGKVVTLPDGRDVVEFVSCSYLGLDTHPEVIAGARRVLEDYGVHFCCARSRFSIDPTRELEEGLSRLFGARAITFPSVTSAHMSALPLLASGVLLDGEAGHPVRLLVDRQAHASMQFMRPVLAEEAAIETVPHNDVDALRDKAKAARARGEVPVYVADGVYSMGGVFPVEAVFSVASELEMPLYVDDAHGTSIFGERGEGYVLSHAPATRPRNLFVNFSLAKGYGTNGGGIVVPTARQESLVRSFGQTYAFSGPLDFAIVGAALVVLRMHEDGTVRRMQPGLWRNVERFDPTVPAGDVPTPIKMVVVGDPDRALRLGEALLARGFFVSTAFFPVVPRHRAQLRVCLTAAHTPEQLDGLKHALAAAQAEEP